MSDIPSQAADSNEAWNDLYPQLERLARARLRSAGHMTLLDTVGLVNEAYLRMNSARPAPAASQASFLAYAARTMRSIIIDLVRERGAARRGGPLGALTLNTAVIEGVAANEETPLLMDEALNALSRVDGRLSTLVEMRYFGGFTEGEIAAALGVSERTIQRDWRKASALLRAMIGGGARP